MPGNRLIILIIITAGTIITGCLNSIFTKYQDMQCVLNCGKHLEGEPQFFEQPVLQTLQMFVGESGCWLVILLMKLLSNFSNSEYEEIIDEAQEEAPEETNIGKKKLDLKNSIYLAAPLICDITGTTLHNVGLIYTPVSIYQMMRGSVVLFVAGMSVAFLGRRLTRIDWCSLLVVSLGVVIVGLSGGRNKPEAHESTATNSTLELVFGISLILVGQMFVALQFVVEEYILSNKLHLQPIQLVALEGSYGFILTLTIMVIGYLTIDAGPFDIATLFGQMFHNKTILFTSFLIMVTIGFFNFFGISITHYLSATSRSTVDNCRTLLVWIVSIYLGWELFSFMQLSGFMVLVAGTLVFNGVIQLQDWIRLPKFLTVDQPLKEIEEPLERY